jgi:hypothetical protein
VFNRTKPISVKTEDDILHLQNNELPTFGNVLKPTDSERFLSFLTAPYIRIPLVLDFFANGDPGRLAALRSKVVQMIVDAALFEPGRWKPADFFETFTEVPVVDEAKLQALLATPFGVLFNEIDKSPDLLTSCILKMLQRALDMDVGKYQAENTSGPLILYMIRLAVRVEGFLKFAVKECKKLGHQRPRGLEYVDLNKIELAISKIRKLLNERAWLALEYWIDGSRCKDVGIACMVHAHLLYLFKNCSFEELSKDAVTVILSSQIFLMINHRFSYVAYDDIHDMTDPIKPPPSIQISQSEIFDVIQSKRYDILQYMKRNPEQGNEAMEAVVRIVTGVGTRSMSDSLKMRRWKSIPHPTCFGRFVPDTEDEKLRDGTYRIPRDGQNFEQWMLQVTTKAIGIEVNIQLSDFTLQNHQMRLLDPRVVEHSDFSHTRKYLNDASDIACAEVMHTSNRYWWRLVGRRHDVESWAPDRRNYHDLKGFLSTKFTRKFPNNIRKGESWLADALEAKLPLILPDVTLYLSSDDVSNASFAHLTGWIENPKGQTSYSTHTLKEVFVWQQPPLINVFNVVEYGRRMFRVLEYTSNMSLCLHEVQGDPYPDRIAGILSMSIGIPMTTVGSKESLMISRNLSKNVGNQVFIPKRYLYGILPTALVEHYSFWQNENDDLVGYETSSKVGSDDNVDVIQVGPKTRLRIFMTKAADMDLTGFCNSQADVLVKRIPITDDEFDADNVDPNRPVMTLLNVMTAPPSSTLKRFGMLLSRLDNLSNVLIWSYADVRSINDAATIDEIELPRVNLSFKSKRIEKLDGSTEFRLYSNDHDGLYISTSLESRDITERLLGGISHYIVLQNADNDLFVLIPGCALPRRLNTEVNRLSVQVILDRRNKEWINNMGEIKCYLYPIHNSKGKSNFW